MPSLPTSLHLCHGRLKPPPQKNQAEGKISGIKVSRLVKILHLLFADDILIMSKDCPHEWREIDGLLKTFCCALGLLSIGQNQLYILPTYKNRFWYS
jgi:hypothetical protein